MSMHDDASELRRRAVQLLDGHEKPMHPAAVDKAGRLLRRSLADQLVGKADWTASISVLRRVLPARFRSYRRPTDLDESVEAGCGRPTAIPHPHVHFPSRLANLGKSLGNQDAGEVGILAETANCQRVPAHVVAHNAPGQTGNFRAAQFLHDRGSVGPTTPGAAVRLCVAADVEAYSDHPNPMAELIQQRLVEVLERARRRAGVDERRVSLQLQGDEIFAIFPVGIDESKVIPCFIDGLTSALREVNNSGEAARMRLRVAMHRGLMKEGPTGWIGMAPIAVHRILNADALRNALADHPDVDFVFGVPDVLYEDVLAHSYYTVRGEDFQEVTIDLPEKRFRTHAWIYIPPGSAGRSRGNGALRCRSAQPEIAVFERKEAWVARSVGPESEATDG